MRYPIKRGKDRQGLVKGNPILKARFPRDLAERIEADVERLNANSRGGQVDLSEWLRRAAEQYLAKRSRSRARSSARARALRGVVDGAPAP